MILSIALAIIVGILVYLSNVYSYRSGKLDGSREAYASVIDLLEEELGKMEKTMKASGYRIFAFSPEKMKSYKASKTDNSKVS